MRQILYVSSSNPENVAADVAGIIEQSRHNNAIDGITGLLWSDGLRFVQVIEGPVDSIAATLRRIEADTRHHAITILVDKPIIEREFGDWTMAHQHSGMSSNDYAKRVARVLDGASNTVRAMFLDLIEPSSGG